MSDINRDEIILDYSRDDLLTNFGKSVLSDRYLYQGENFQQMFSRVAAKYSNSKDQAQRIYDYISRHWFMPATPVLSNGGTDRGLPISCYLNGAEDDLDSIREMFSESIHLAASGGGIGSNLSKIRSIGEAIRSNGKTSGIIPFLKVLDSQTLAISQGSLRRGSAAAYLDISHPEIEEFLDVRRPTGGDPNRKCLNIHHGICISDAFMEAVEKNEMWNLVSPHTGKVVNSVKARDLWIKILTCRAETGEPYILFIDTINRNIPEHHKKLGLKVSSSNLCSEITLPTGRDHLGNERTAVCCLSSVNLEYFDEWGNDDLFIKDIMCFLDNILNDFIERAHPNMYRAVYSAKRERSVGLGVMGFHSFLQSKNIPFESAMAKVWNKKMFQRIKQKADEASRELAEELGPCEDAAEVGMMERFSNKLAVAPTASISIIAGNSSPGIEPYVANSYTQKTLSGSFNVRNKHLTKLLESKGKNTDQVWSSITINEGSVQHLDFLTEDEKLVFRTAQEMDQRWLIEHAADRTPYICQAQSLNIFLPANVHKKVLHDLHFQAWKKGIKSNYYMRSTSLQRADKVSNKLETETMEDLLARQKALLANAETEMEKALVAVVADNKYEECLACQ